MTEKKPARRSAEREIMKQDSLENPIKLAVIISPKEIPVNDSEEIGLCRFWQLFYGSKHLGMCRESCLICRKADASHLRYLRCRTYQSWLVEQNV